jgi:hypothetical protein
MQHLQKVCYQLSPIRCPTNNVIVATEQDVAHSDPVDLATLVSPTASRRRSLRLSKKSNSSTAGMVCLGPYLVWKIAKLVFEGTALRETDNHSRNTVRLGINRIPEFHSSVPSSPPNVREVHCTDDHVNSPCQTPVLSSRPSSPVPDSPSVEKSKRMGGDNSASEESFNPAKMHWKRRLVPNNVCPRLICYLV